MIENIAYYFSKRLSSDTDEQEILQYGLECFINTLIPTIFYFTFAVLQNMIFKTIIWIVLFLLLRNYIGGYHASSHARCITLSTLYGLLTLFCIYYFNYIPLIVEICSCIIITIFHILFGPLINDKNLSGNYKKYKIIGLIIIVSESTIMLILNFNNIQVHSCIFFSLISAEFLHYVERCNHK